MNKIIIPPIKSQGIKIKLIPYIKELIPSNFNGRWIEPFMGTGAVAFNITAHDFSLADTNPYIINFYNDLKYEKITVDDVKKNLIYENINLLSSGEKYYYDVRDRFNQDKDSLDFLFLNRSCFNGLMRFNKNGEFNVPFCKRLNRFSPAYITKICNQIQSVVNLFSIKDFTFQCQDYYDTILNASFNDIIYCDPPYIDRNNCYFNKWDNEHEKKLFNLLSNIKTRFILSTWHSNTYRYNSYIDMWSKFNIAKIEHFYYVGSKENYRHSMIEAIITNF